MAGQQKKKEPFWLGGAAACMAVCFTHPLDQTKYRMQVHKSRAPMLSTVYLSATQNGIPSLWTGLSASILRQGTYSTARFGIHSYLSAKALKWTENDRLPASLNILCAGIAGGLAGLIGNPAEIVLVRMCADGAKPPSQRFGYSNALDGLFRVWREEGLSAFGKGISANITRSVLMSKTDVSQIATYSSAKQFLLHQANLDDNTYTHAAASLAAGTVATTVCAPADVLKSRMQSASGSQGLRAVIRSGLEVEGLRFLMKGWMPAWLRLTPHTVLTFVFMEKLRELTTLRVLHPSKEAAEM